MSKEKKNQKKNIKRKVLLEISFFFDKKAKVKKKLEVLLSK